MLLEYRTNNMKKLIYKIQNNYDNSIDSFHKLILGLGLNLVFRSFEARKYTFYYYNICIKEKLIGEKV